MFSNSGMLKIVFSVAIVVMIGKPWLRGERPFDPSLTPTAWQLYYARRFCAIGASSMQLLQDRRMTKTAEEFPKVAQPSRTHARAILAAIIFLFCVIRGPLLFRIPGAMDEEHYAVAGWAVAEYGIPKNPTIPSRDLESAFYKADEALFAMPPAFFYWQAPFFLIFPGSSGTARLGSAMAGIITIILVAKLGRALWNDATGLWAAGLYSVSRFFYFAATTARPDMLCWMFGVASVLAMWNWQETEKTRYLAGAGLLIGLGGLSHPFAMAYGILAGGWILVRSADMKSAARALGILAGSMLLAFSLWLPLVLTYYEHFRIQFYNNIIHPGHQGLLTRFMMPWESIIYHFDMLLKHVGPIQMTLAYGSLILTAAISFRTDERSRRRGVRMILFGVLALIVCQGTHYANGYWCYGGALLFLAVGRLFALIAEQISGSTLVRTTATGALIIAASLIMVPGSGLRTWFVHVRNWDNPNYNGPQFAAALIDSLPERARFTVGDEFVLDFFLAGRDTISSHTLPLYFRADQEPFDFLIISRRGLLHSRQDDFSGAVFERSVGDENDVFSCYARIYRYHPPDEISSSPNAADIDK